MGNSSSKKKDKKSKGAPAEDTCGAWIAKTQGADLEYVEDWKLPGWTDDQIEIEVTHNGLCHTDIHMKDNEWGVSAFPLCAGHEVIGIVKHKGKQVKRINVGDRVGVGWMKGSCGDCVKCENDCQSVCFKNYKGTIVGIGGFKSEAPSGGFARRIRVNENFAFPIPKKISSAAAAPLMCAGATVWAPIRRYVQTNPHGAKNMRVGVAGIGGLGHMALKLLVPMGCEVFALSSSDSKKEWVKSINNDINYVNMSSEDDVKDVKGSLDFVLNTIPFPSDHGGYIGLLRNDATYCVVGIPNDEVKIGVIPLVFMQYHVVGSIVAGRADMMSMLNFCAKHKIQPTTVIKDMSEINECMDDVMNKKVPHRYVLTFGDEQKRDPAESTKEVATEKAEETKEVQEEAPAEAETKIEEKEAPAAEVKEEVVEEKTTEKEEEEKVDEVKPEEVEKKEEATEVAEAEPQVEEKENVAEPEATAKKEVATETEAAAEPAGESEKIEVATETEKEAPVPAEENKKVKETNEAEGGSEIPKDEN